MKVLITGGAGFIGSHLAESFYNDSYDVYVIDNLSTGNLKNIDFLPNDKFYNIDISDTKKVNALLTEKDFDIIIHLAAIVSVVDTITNPMYSNNININSTLNLLEIIKNNKLNVKKFIFASSAAVYGDEGILPNSLESTVNPKSPYAIQKFASEQYCKIFNEIYNIPAFALRFFNVYGPRQNPNSQYSGVISILKKSYQTKTPFVLYGDGSQTRDFVYVKDVVGAIRIIAEKDNLKEKVFNVGTGKETSLNKIIETFSNHYGQVITIKNDDFRKGDIYRSYADISLLQKYGYKQNYSLTEGLEIYINE